MTELPTKDIQKEEIPVDTISEQKTNVTKHQFLGNILIEDLRKEHIGKTINLIGIIKKYSKVMTKTISAKFECPSCGNIIPVIQNEDILKEPSRCSCGRKSGFKIIDDEKVDFQILTVSDDPSKIDDSRIVRTITVFLKENLTIATLEKTIKLNKKIRIIGNVVETSGISTIGNYSLECLYFSVGEQESDKELKEYIINHFHISSIQAQFLVVLRNNNWNISNSVRRMGINRKTHYDWLKDKDYEEAYKFIQDDKVDFIESEMMNIIKNGSEKAKTDLLKFYAKTKLGYTETQNIHHSGQIDTLTKEEREQEIKRLLGK